MWIEKIFACHKMCCNPNLELTIKVRAYKGVGQE